MKTRTVGSAHIVTHRKDVPSLRLCWKAKSFSFFFIPEKERLWATVRI